MKYVYLLIAGILASSVHTYLVWHHRGNRRYSISEHAIIDRSSQILYFVTHVIVEIFVLLYAYQFFLVEHGLKLPFYMLVVFCVLDFVMAALPSRGKTEKVHFAAAYVSWVCYLLAGIVAMLQLTIEAPYGYIAALLYVPLLGMFAYMHVNRSKLYPFQLLMVPLYVVCLLLITIGAS